jgi:surface protein
MSIIGLNKQLIGKRVETNLFTITVKTDNAGTTADNEFLLPIYGSNFEVITSEQNLTELSSPPTLQWSFAGTYVVKVKGNFDYIRFDNQYDKLKLLSIDNWGNNKWTSLSNGFNGCANLVLNTNNAPDLSIVTSISRLFQGCTSFNQNISNWNVSNVQDFSYCFSGAISYNQPIENWNMSSAINISYMFQGCASFNQPLNGWVTSNVTNLYATFINSNFNQPINSWDVSKVTTMAYLFTNSPFNQTIDNWDVSNVTSMSNMFYGSSFNQPLNSWDVSNVSNMTYMFYGSSFNQPLNSWDVSNVTSMLKMFMTCSSFDQDISNWNVSKVSNFAFFMFAGGLSKENYDSLLTSWSQLNLVDNVSVHFGNSSNSPYGEVYKNNIINNFNWSIIDGGLSNDLFSITVKTDNPGTTANNEFLLPVFGSNFTVIKEDQILSGLSTPPILSWSVAGTYKIYLDGNFDYIRFDNQYDKLKLLSIDKWGLNQFTSLERSFYGCANMLLNANDAPILSNVTSISRCFQDCESFVNIDLQSWNVSNIQDFSYFMYSCGSLVNSIDCTGWNTSNMLTMQGIFGATGRSTTALLIGSWNVSNCVNFSYAFYNTGINPSIGNWNTSAGENFSYMFGYNSEFNQNINSWDVSNGVNFQGMFWWALSFNKPLDNWSFKTSGLIIMTSMFGYDGSGGAMDFDQDISSWNINQVTSLTSFMLGCNLSTTNYDAILSAWSQLTLQSNIAAHFGGSQYTITGETAKNSIITNFNWTITDGGII